MSEPMSREPAPSASVQDWQVVPRNPDTPMQKAGTDAVYAELSRQSGGLLIARKTWEAMCAAAPRPAQVTAPELVGLPACWMFTNEEGDEDFLNNPSALAGKHFRGGPPVPLWPRPAPSPRPAQGELARLDMGRHAKRLRYWDRGDAHPRDRDLRAAAEFLEALAGQGSGGENE